MTDSREIEWFANLLFIEDLLDEFETDPIMPNELDDIEARLQK